MMEVDDGNVVAQVILAANKLEQARDGSYDSSRKVAEQLLEMMTQAESEMSPLVRFLLASNIIDALQGGIKPIKSKSTRSNQLRHINLQTTYSLSKIVQLCIRWASPKGLERQCCKRLISKIVKVINLWKQEFPTVPEVATVVHWPEPVFSLKSVDSELIPPKDISSSFDIKLTPERRLRHATSTFNSLKIISEIRNQEITFSTSSSNPSKGSPLVWCGVVLEEEEIRKIPQRSQGYVRENRYGSVIFEFPLQSTPRFIRDAPVGYVLGTRKYIYEHSQVILIPESNSRSPPDDMQFVINDTGDQITPLTKVDLKIFDWKLSYNWDGDWTHPELVFANDLNVPVSQIKISFADHNCPTQKSENCYDCEKKIRTKEDARNHFKQLMHSENCTRLIESTLGSAFSSEDYGVLFGSHEMQQDGQT